MINFQTHLNQVYKLASHTIYLLSKIRNLLTEHAALTIYRSKILPYFDYGDILYHSALNHNADRLQKLQNRALRICLKAEARTPILNLHNRAKLPLLKHRRIAHIRNLAYKRSCREQYIMKTTRTTRAGTASQLKFWLARNNMVANSLYNTCATEWNLLDPTTRSIPTLARFKEAQRKWLTSNVPIT